MTNTWYTAAGQPAQDRLKAAWNDAPLMNLEALGLLLSVAKTQVIAYAPAADDLSRWGTVQDFTDAPPDELVYAQLQQAKNLWNAGRAGGDGQIGGEFSYTPRPLDKTIQSIIRPTNVSPRVY